MNWRKIPSYVSLFFAFECQLIFLVKQYPMLYDINHALFFDSEIKREAWRRIQEKIGKSRRSCKRKWRNLKYGYMYRERFRELGREFPYTSAMSFLNQFAHIETYGDFDCSLIILVKLNPVLYDTGHELFYDQEARKAAWQRIQCELEEPGDWCMTRWTFLKMCYIRRKRLFETAVGWPYMRAMRFIDPFISEVFEQPAAMVTHRLSEEDGVGDDEQEDLSSRIMFVVALVFWIIWLLRIYLQLRVLF